MSISTIKIETNIIALMDVLNQTGNPTVAVAILEGTYETPYICMGDKAKESHKKDELLRLSFKSYDRFKDEVTYYRGNWGYESMSRETWNSLQLWVDSEIVSEENL